VGVRAPSQGQLAIVAVESGDKGTWSSLAPPREPKLGLQVNGPKKRRVYSQLRIPIDEDSTESSVLERDIVGLYTLFDQCGTANGELHKEPAAGGVGLPPHLSLDPIRCTDPRDDRYAFSVSKIRYESGEIQPTTCALDPKRRQISTVEGTKPTADPHVSSCGPGLKRWAFRYVFPYCLNFGGGDEKFPSPHRENATFSIPLESFTIGPSLTVREHACAVLVCCVPLTKLIQNGRGDAGWRLMKSTNVQPTKQSRS